MTTLCCGKHHSHLTDTDVKVREVRWLAPCFPASEQEQSSKSHPALPSASHIPWNTLGSIPVLKRNTFWNWFGHIAHVLKPLVYFIKYISLWSMFTNTWVRSGSWRWINSPPIKGVYNGYDWFQFHSSPRVPGPPAPYQRFPGLHRELHSSLPVAGPICLLMSPKKIFILVYCNLQRRKFHLHG